ncbi:hypothetical protein FHL15_001299 [Xylaria flabelliformis]|uniref:Uncharacterized protein n=1 Tax=Xylaria flabelliformis TaxID=2512241 RepID=A0A553IBG4_9PEZI|nr:hypothetical protein FHL15_001299 [Xylaria flabelliformis]
MPASAPPLLSAAGRLVAVPEAVVEWSIAVNVEFSPGSGSYDSRAGGGAAVTSPARADRGVFDPYRPVLY